MNIFSYELLLWTRIVLIGLTRLNIPLSVHFPWHLLLIVIFLSAFLSISAVTLIMVLFLIAINSNLLGILLLEFLDKLICVLNVFVSLLLLGDFHEFHCLESLGFILILLFVLHLCEFSFQVHNRLLHIILIIVLLRQILQNVLIYLVLLELFLSYLIYLIYGILNWVFVVLVKSQKILNMLGLCIVSKRNTLHDSVLG